MLAGLEAALDVAPEWRFERAAAIAAQCREALSGKYELVGDPPLATLVSFLPQGEPAATTARLYDRGVIVRDLPGTGWVRASCGWWTNEDDIDRLIAGLAA
jgi:selenocysteine lyase/cysteine desulfurase